MLFLDAIEDDPPSLPDKLPDPPSVPIADLSEERQLVERAELSAEQQLALVASLQGKVRNADDRPAVVALLTKLKEREDVTAAAEKVVAELIARYRQPPRDPQSTKLLKSVARAIERENCVPILGSGMTDWLVGSRKLLAQEWAKEYGYPLRLGASDALPQIAQYIAVTETNKLMRDDLREFFRKYLQSQFPTVSPDGDTLDDLIVGVWQAEACDMVAEPHDVLARLPCKLYISTVPTGLLREALRARGKSPREDFCRWTDELKDAYPASETRHNPTIDEPLVYNVFGTLEYPESIVITEDDYFDFIGAISEDPSLIPTEIRETIAESSLLFLGFGLQDWDVRVLLRALVSREIADDMNGKKHFAAEVDPSEDVELRDGARDYLRDYFARTRPPSIDIFWSSVEAFCEGLESIWAEKMLAGG